MKTVKRTLAVSAFALSAALLVSAPASAAEGKTARVAHGGERFVQTAGRHGHAKGPRGRFKGHRRDFHGPRGHVRGHRGHFRHGGRHFRGQRPWYRHRPYRRGHGYWWHPRFGHRYGYGYGHLGRGSHFVIRIH